LVCPQDFTINADPWFCVTSTILPLPIAFDGCSELGVTSIQVSGGSLLNMGPDGYILANLQPGETYTVTVKVKDECKNTAECVYTVTVVDEIPPVPICDEHTIVSLIEDGSVAHGLTKVPVSTFDDGSYDNCGPFTIEARRMSSCIDFDWTTNGAGYDDDPNGVVNAADRGLTFGPYVPFACCDAQIGSDSHAPPIMVQLRLTDQYGNVNFCMVEVEVQDKLSPFVECLPEIEVSCEFWFEATETNGFVPLNEDPLTSVFGTMLDAYSYDPDDRALIVIDDPGRPTSPSDPNYLPQPHQWGVDGWTDDNCQVELTVRVRIYDDCTGDLPGAAPDHATRLIERTFRSRDGNNNSTTCIQRIWVVDFTPFYIADATCNNTDPNDGVIWPCDRTYTTCPGEIPVDEPVLFDDNCNLIGVDYDDEIFTFVDGACMKILRTWTVIDWCQY
ncbi:MAG: hypothetical protein R3330_14835, partial [Saprospiraceae bacterium]|nr:hypothetical protein [Saprospiraceae bacterium]